MGRQLRNKQVKLKFYCLGQIFMILFFKPTLSMRLKGVSNSPTRRVGESFFGYEYLREFEAKIGTARNVV